ncbi:hypothetical protein HDU86_001951 [Geranomyces michiganensis]|nr:hypothetical protein HDU86_001951 [Geranomyces michiganensis]
MLSWLATSLTPDDRRASGSAELAHTSPPPSPPHNDPASAGSSDSEGASLAGFPRQSFDTLQSNASTISAPWFDHATPNHPMKVPKDDLPEATPWFSAATLDAPFPPPPPAPWFAEASVYSPVRVSSPPPASPSSQGYFDIPAAKERKSVEGDSDGSSPPFFSAVATMKKPFRLRKSKKKIGNGNSAPKPISTSRAESKTARRYPVSEYAANTDSETESCISTKSEPVNLRKLTTRNSFGFFSLGLGLGLGARVNSIVPPPLPPRPPPSVTSEQREDPIHDDDNDPEIESDAAANTSFISSLSSFSAPSPSRTVGSLVKKESLVFYSHKPPSPPTTPAPPSRATKMMRSAVEQIDDTTLMLSRLVRSAKRVVEPSEAAEAIGRITSVDVSAGGAERLLECVDRSVTRVEVLLQAVLPRAAAREKDEGVVLDERSVKRTLSIPEVKAVDFEARLTSSVVPELLDGGAPPPAYTARAATAAESEQGYVQLVNVAERKTAAEPSTVAAERGDCTAAPVPSETLLASQGVTFQPVLPVATGCLAIMDLDIPRVVKAVINPADDANAKISTCVHLPTVLTCIAVAADMERSLTAVIDSHALAMPTEQILPVGLGMCKLVTLEFKEGLVERIKAVQPVAVGVQDKLFERHDHLPESLNRGLVLDPPAQSALAVKKHVPRAHGVAAGLPLHNVKEVAVLHSRASPMLTQHQLPLINATSSKSALELGLPTTVNTEARPVPIDNHPPLARARSMFVSLQEPKTSELAPAAEAFSVDRHLPVAQAAKLEPLLRPTGAVERQSVGLALSAERHVPLARASLREIDVAKDVRVAKERLLGVKIRVEKHFPLARPSSVEAALDRELETTFIPSRRSLIVLDNHLPLRRFTSREASLDSESRAKIEVPAAIALSVNRHLPLTKASSREKLLDAAPAATAVRGIPAAPLSLTRYLPSFVLADSDVAADAALEICHLLSPPVSRDMAQVSARKTEVDLSLAEEVVEVGAVKEVYPAARHLPVATAVQREVPADREARAQIFLTIDQPPTLVSRHVPVAVAAESVYELETDKAVEVAVLGDLDSAAELSLSLHTPVATGVRREAAIDSEASVDGLDPAGAPVSVLTHLPRVIALCGEHDVDAVATVKKDEPAIERGIMVHLPSAKAMLRSDQVSANAVEVMRAEPATEVFVQLHFPAVAYRQNIMNVDPKLCVRVKKERDEETTSRELAAIPARSQQTVTKAVGRAAGAVTPFSRSIHLPTTSAARRSLDLNAELICGTKDLPQSLPLAHHMPTIAAALSQMQVDSAALAISDDAGTRSAMSLVDHRPQAHPIRRSILLDAQLLAKKTESMASVPVSRHFPITALVRTDLDFDKEMWASIITPACSALSADTVWPSVPGALRVVDVDAERTASSVAAGMSIGVASLSAIPTSAAAIVPNGTPAQARSLGAKDAGESAAEICAARALLSSAHSLPTRATRKNSAEGEIPSISQKRSLSNEESQEKAQPSPRAVVPPVRTGSTIEIAAQDSSKVTGADVFDQMFASYFVSPAGEAEPEATRAVVVLAINDISNPSSGDFMKEAPSALTAASAPVAVTQTAGKLPFNLPRAESMPSRPRKSSDRLHVASDRAREEFFSPDNVPEVQIDRTAILANVSADGDWTPAAARRGTTIRSRSHTLDGRRRPEPQSRTTSDTAVIASSRSAFVRSRDKFDRLKVGSDAVAGAEDIIDRLRPMSTSSADSTTAVVDGGSVTPALVAPVRPAPMPSDLRGALLTERHVATLAPPHETSPSLLLPPSTPQKHFYLASNKGTSAASRVDSGVSDLSSTAASPVRSAIVTRALDAERTAAAVAAAVPVFLHLSPAEAAAKGLEQEHQWTLAHHMKRVIVARAEIQAASKAAPCHDGGQGVAAKLATPLDLIAKASLTRNAFAGYLAGRNRSALAVMQTVTRQSAETPRSFDAKRSLSISRDKHIGSSPRMDSVPEISAADGAGKERDLNVNTVAPYALDRELYDIENASPVLSPSAEPAAYPGKSLRNDQDVSDNDSSDDDEDAERGRQPSSPSARGSLATTWLPNLAALISVSAFALFVGILFQAAPILARGPVFGPNVSSFAAELPLAALLITAAGSGPLWARAGGIIGALAPLTACIALFTLFVALIAGVTDWNAIIALAACAGLFAGGALPLSFLLVRETTKTRHAVLSLVVLVFAIVLAVACGPIIGHALLLRGYDHWRWLFLVPALVAVLGLVACAALIWKARRATRESGFNVGETAGIGNNSSSSARNPPRHHNGLGLGVTVALSLLLAVSACAVLWGGQYPTFGGAQAGGGGGTAAMRVADAAPTGDTQSGLALDTSPDARVRHAPPWVQNSDGVWVWAPEVFVPGGISSGGPTPGGAAPGGAAPAGTAPGGTTPGGTAPGGTTPGGAAPGGTVPGGAFPGGNIPGGTVPGGVTPGVTPGGTAPGGTAPGGGVPGGIAPGATAPGGAVPGGTAPGGAAPGGTAPGGTAPGGATPSSGGTAPVGVIPGGIPPGGAAPGGVVPPTQSSSSATGTSPTAAPAPYPSSLGPGADAPRNPNVVRLQSLSQCRMPPTFNDLPGTSTSTGTATAVSAPLLSKPTWAGVFSALAIIAIGTMVFITSSLITGKNGRAVATATALAAGSSGFAAFAAVARYPPLVVTTLACQPSAALLYPIVGAVVACILLAALPHSKASHARPALPGSAAALLGIVLVAIDIGDGASGTGFAVMCFGTVVVVVATVAAGVKSRNPLIIVWVAISVLVGLGFGALLANTAFRAHASSQFLPFTPSASDAATADAIGDGTHLVHRAVAVPLAVLAVTGWACSAALANRAR